MEAIMEFTIHYILMPFLLIMFAGLVFLLPFAIYRAVKQSRSATFELYKNEWQCTKTEKVSTTTYSIIGGLIHPQTSTTDVCVCWEKIK